MAAPKMTSLRPAVGADAGVYGYQPLGDRQIRLLRLRPAPEPDAVLHGDLFIADLDALPPVQAPNSPAPDAPPDPSRYICFDAVSYVWGPAALTDTLVTPHGSVPITTSLASVLRRLRPPDGEPALLWADAVCIDQADAREKGRQVGLMGTIYASAARVMCDLGDGFPDAQDILDAMTAYRRRNIRRGIPMSQGDWPRLDGPDAAAIMGLDLPTEDEAAAIPEVDQGALVKPFRELLSSPWFRRLWVVQEFVLGRDVVMLVGRHRLSWGELWAGISPYNDVIWPWGSDAPDFALTFDVLLPYQAMCTIRACRLADPATPHGRVYIDIMKDLNGVTDVAHIIDLPMCLVGFCASGVTIPHDRYFAILGLLGPDLPPDLRPDYDAPLEDITLRFWRAAYRRATGADLINVAGLSGRAPQYPTWVRDITTSSFLHHMWSLGPLIEASHAAGGRGGCGTFSATFFDDDPGRMFVRAFRLDDVTDILSTSKDEAFDLETLIVRMRDAFAFFTSGRQTIDCPADLRYAHTAEHVHEAAWKTMSNHNNSDARPGLAKKFEDVFKVAVALPLVTRSDAVEGKTILEKCRASQYGREKAAVMLLAERFYYMWGMRFCKTQKGYFAALHQDVHPGDSIWIMAGSRLPAVLRPSASHPGCFEFLGGGYVHGMMNEQVMQLPGFKWRGLSLR